MGYDPGQPDPSNAWMNAGMLRSDAARMQFADRSGIRTPIPE
jgi:hypothetical protein